MCPACPSARAAGCRCPYTFVAGRRVRHPDLARARSRTETSSGLRGAAAARADGAARPAAGRNFTVQKPADGDDTLLDKDLKTRVPVTRRPARARRHVRQEWLVAARNGTAAPAVALQRQAPSAHHARDRPGFDHRTIRGEGRGRTRRAAAGYSSAGPKRRAPGRRPRSSKEEACAKKILSTLMRRAYRRPIAEGGCRRARWRSIAKDGPRRTSTRESARR